MASECWRLVGGNGEGEGEGRLLWKVNLSDEYISLISRPGFNVLLTC